MELVQGRRIIDYTLALVDSMDAVVAVAFAVHGELPAELLGAIREGRRRPVIVGPPERDRAAASRRALEVTPPHDRVLVCDPDRPLLTRSRLADFLAQSRSHAIAACAVPVRDTYKEVFDDRVERTVPRENLLELQTPWVFDRAKLMTAIAPVHGPQPDELTACHRLRMPIKILPGNPFDVPVRRLDDLPIVERLMAAQRRA